MSRTDLADAGSLSEALREHLHRIYADTPVAERRSSRWVMNLEWFSEVQKLDNRSFWDGPPAPVESILGLPLEIREDGGPPHLEPA